MSFQTKAPVPVRVAPEIHSTRKNRLGESARSVLRIAAVLSALAFLALFLGVVMMIGVGNFLVLQDSLEKANTIAVLSGGFPSRVLEAAALYREGYAKEIWLTNPSSDSPELKNMGIHVPSEADFNFQVLRRQGIPAKAIHVLDGAVLNTADELEVISGELQKLKETAAVIVVTDKPHTRRVRTLWEHFDAPHRKAIVHGVNADEFDPDGWWKSTEDTRQVIHEMVGMANIWAGLPMRTRLREKAAVAGLDPQRSVPLPKTDVPSATTEPIQQE